MRRFNTLFALFTPVLLFANDTLKVTLRQADSIFIAKNFQLLASKMEIERQKAFVIQARVYPNPVLTADFNLYDPQNKKYLHVDETGQKSFQFEQLILLGGKRKAEIEIARTNVMISELEFEDLLRELKYELHSSLFVIHQQKYLLNKFSQQLSLLDSIVQSYDVQVKKGNLPLKDAIRLKSVYLNLNNQRSELYNEYFEQLAKIQMILQTNTEVELIFEVQSFDKFEKTINLDNIFSVAFTNRPDYRIEEKNRELADQFLVYQKKLAIPDVNIFTSYDQRGGAFNSQINGGLSIPLPVWNRNRGNIKAAKAEIKRAEFGLAEARMKVETQIRLGFNHYQVAISDYNKSKKYYSSDFEEVVQGITYNFQKRNITLIEFVDFFESYNNALNEVARTRMQLAASAKQLNYLTASELFTNE